MDFGTQANFLEQDRLGEEKMYFNFFFFFLSTCLHQATLITVEGENMKISI